MKESRIIEHYRDRKQEIQERLEEFEQLRGSGEERLFQELVYVILSSQSSAENAWKAAEELEEKNLLMDGNTSQIAQVLGRNGIQYEQNKAGYIVENRKKLSQPTLSDPSTELKLGNRIDPENLEKTRKQLVGDLKGIGWKGASHFLRNIGYGNGFAIISSYISKNLYKLGIKENAEQPADKQEYIQLEQEMKDLAEGLGIDIKALDLVLWSMETGEIFK